MNRGYTMVYRYTPSWDEFSVQPTADPTSNQLANELYVISEKSFVALYRLVNRDSQFIDDDTDQYIQIYSMYRG